MTEKKNKTDKKQPIKIRVQSPKPKCRTKERHRNIEKRRKKKNEWEKRKKTTLKYFVVQYTYVIYGNEAPPTRKRVKRCTGIRMLLQPETQ